HADDCRAWDDSRHAAAWATLVEKRSQFDPYCQQCHTTGYGLSGGFASVARGAERTAVGCESCHGPSQAHAEREQIKTSYLARDRCIRCHDRENSPEFEFEAYWSQIEHGGRR
ncbi:MAG TPA: multiheme c-type cytochrome, partial [Thermomicrobiales bacterium]|nr:multiheme c-type cytochrome [Thermomicrobiales bacterium]